MRKRKGLKNARLRKTNKTELSAKFWADQFWHDADLIEVLGRSNLEIRPSREIAALRANVTKQIINSLERPGVTIDAVGSVARETDLNTSDIDFVATFTDWGSSHQCLRHIEDTVMRLGTKEVRQVYYRGVGVSVHGRLGSVRFDILVARGDDYDAGDSNIDMLTWTRPLTLLRHNRLKVADPEQQDACRLAKWWCKQQDYPEHELHLHSPGSFLVELLARKAIASASASLPSVGRFFFNFLCLVSKFEAYLIYRPNGFWLLDPCEPTNNVAQNFKAWNWDFLAGRADAILTEYTNLCGERAISDAQYALSFTGQVDVLSNTHKEEEQDQKQAREVCRSFSELREAEYRLEAVSEERDRVANELFESESRLEAVSEERDSAVNGLREAMTKLKVANMLQGQALASVLPRISHHARYRVETLDMETPLACFYSSLITESCVSHRASLGSEIFHPAAVLSVQQVDVIFNPRLQQKYELELNDIHGKMKLLGQSHPPLAELEKNKVALDGPFCIDCEEHFLLHGAPQDKLEKIKTGGLDPRRGGQSAGRLFGLASYLAINATKADLYTDADVRSPETGRHNLRQIVIVRVALGDCYRTKVALRDATLPPDRDDGKPRDSVLAVTRQNGGCVDHVEVMVYRESQMLPVAIVSYRHAVTCACALCRRRAD